MVGRVTPGLGDARVESGREGDAVGDRRGLCVQPCGAEGPGEGGILNGGFRGVGNSDIHRESIKVGSAAEPAVHFWLLVLQRTAKSCLSIDTVNSQVAASE